MERELQRERPHERLDVWRDAMELAVVVYEFSAALPESERFGLVLQVRRAAVSIPSNIAEGAARRSTRDYLRFLAMARGSISELDTQVQLVQRLWPVALPDRLYPLVDRTFARLNALITALDRRIAVEATPYLPVTALSESPIPNPESHA